MIPSLILIDNSLRIWRTLLGGGEILVKSDRNHDGNDGILVDWRTLDDEETLVNKNSDPCTLFLDTLGGRSLDSLDDLTFGERNEFQKDSTYKTESCRIPDKVIWSPSKILDESLWI